MFLFPFSPTVHHARIPQGVKLSREERLDLEMRRQKLKYAEELLKAREALDNMEEYRMPDMIDDKTASKRYEMLTERYRDPDAEDAEAPWKEQENWENERLKKASMKVWWFCGDFVVFARLRVCVYGCV